MDHERKGSGRSLVLLHSAPQRELIDELATKFDVLAFTVAAGSDVTLELKVALEQHRVERPLLVGQGAGADAAVAIASKRIPRGMVLVGEERTITVPLLVLTDAELALPGRVAERIAEFDAPLS